MMKPSLSLNLNKDGTACVLEADALFSALPEKFKLRSKANGHFHVDPEVSEIKILKQIGKHKVILESTRGRSREITLILDQFAEAVCVFSWAPGKTEVEILSSKNNAPAILNAITKVMGKYPFENKKEEGVWLDYSHATQNGVNRDTQFIHCPKWSEVNRNYTPEVQKELQWLMGLSTPWERGRLLIWHGATGTGKTFALRSLLMAWRDKFDFLVVTDPEKLTGNPSYYYQVASKPIFRPRRARDFEEEEEEENPHAKRLLIIFEDSADLIITESRTRHYEKVSKLLNITDGLIGQGREDVFLVTFNEDIKDIDPAFLRPGRCISRLEFGKLPPQTSSEWLRKHGVTGDHPKEDMALCDLYEKLNTKKGPKRPVQRPTGFGASARPAPVR